MLGIFRESSMPANKKPKLNTLGKKVKMQRKRSSGFQNPSQAARTVQPELGELVPAS